MKFIRFADGLYNESFVFCFEIENTVDNKVLIRLYHNDIDMMDHVVTEEFEDLQQAKRRLGNLELDLN